MAVPLIPLAIGAGVSAIGKGLEGYFAQDRAKDQSEILADAVRDAMAKGDQGYSDVSQMYQPYQQAGTQALGQLVGGDFSTPVNQFNYNQQVSDFLDPSMAYQQDQMRRQLESSQAYQGDLLSGGAMKELQDRSQQLAMQDWGNAQQRMMQDKQFAYQTFADDFARRQANNQLRLQQLQQQANMGQNATGALSNARMQTANNQAQMTQNLGNVKAAGVAPGLGETISGVVGDLANPQNLGSLLGIKGGNV